MEFARVAGKPITFRVGTSEAQKDWPSRQLSGDSYRIVFSLPSTKGAYELKIGTLIDQPRIPALRIDVNGNSGMFYLHPDWTYSRSDFSYPFDPHELQSKLAVQLPSDFLKSGKNVITTTCADDPATPAGEKDIGWISYDALSLEQQTSGKPDVNEVKVNVEPTIFYHSGPSGLTEVVDAFIRFARPWLSEKVDFTVKGNYYSAQLTAGTFGEQRIRLMCRNERERSASLFQASVQTGCRAPLWNAGREYGPSSSHRHFRGRVEQTVRFPETELRDFP